MGYVSFWPCQRNLIKTLQIEAITPLITKIVLKISFEHFPSNLLEPQKSTFGHLILGIKMKSSKNSFYKSWASKLIFSNDFF